MFGKKVIRYIEEKQLFGKSERILVALSGGADSVALLRVLVHAGYVCEAAHCNFHLRGEESVRDENFVRKLTEQLSVPLHVTHFDTAGYAFRKAFPSRWQHANCVTGGSSKCAGISEQVWWLWLIIETIAWKLFTESYTRNRD